MNNEPTEEQIREIFERLAEEAQRSLVPQIMNSVMVTSIIEGDKSKDVWMALQIGLALLYDKPLILIGTQNAELPARLRQVAEMVIEAPTADPSELKEKFAAAVSEMLRKRGIKH